MRAVALMGGLIFSTVFILTGEVRFGVVGVACLMVSAL